MTPTTSRAAVKVAANTTEIQTFDVPDLDQHPEGGLLRVEATGVCGADVMWYPREGEPREDPTILGHHIVGVVEQLSDRARSALSLEVGDRILIEEYLPCGTCLLCREGLYRLCPTTTVSDPESLRYGASPVTTAPALWGGYSEYVFLHERSVAHRLSDDLPTDLATLILPMSNGIQWVQQDAGLHPGGTLVIIGPGQHGLCCVAAAQDMGAEHIVVVGLPGDEGRLELARSLGATHTSTDADEALRTIHEITNGRMADAVLDLASGAPATVKFGLEALGIEGTLLLGVWQADPTPVPMRQLALRKITLKPLRGHSYEAVDAARRLIESRKLSLEVLCTGTVGLEDVHQVLSDLNDPSVRGGLIHMAVDPWK